jgi:hypothetical protein
LGTGVDINQMVQQNVPSAQSPINHLKNKLNGLGKEEDDTGMRNFKPNNQKTKNFLDRIELGTNVQSIKGNSFFPVTTDLGFNAGYKLNDKSIIGLGASYKLGWGKDIRHINLSHQGIGFRSYVDWKLKGSFWVSGGYEQNYRSEFQNIAVLREYSAWQASGLIGLSKKYKVSKKFKGSMQLLWDFLSYRQVPRTQAVVWRVGYSFE